MENILIISQRPQKNNPTDNCLQVRKHLEKETIVLNNRNVCAFPIFMNKRRTA